MLFIYPNLSYIHVVGVNVAIDVLLVVRCEFNPTVIICPYRVELVSLFCR